MSHYDQEAAYDRLCPDNAATVECACGCEHELEKCPRCGEDMNCNTLTLTPAARRALEDLRRPGWYADETSSHKTAAIVNSYACSDRRVLRATIDELVEAGLVKFGGYNFLGLSRWVAVEVVS